MNKRHQRLSLVFASLAILLTLSGFLISLLLEDRNQSPVELTVLKGRTKADISPKSPALNDQISEIDPVAEAPEVFIPNSFPIPPSPARAEKAWSVSPFGVVRGPNQEMVLSPSEKISRKVTSGKVFEEPLVKVRSRSLAGPLTWNEQTLTASEASYDPAVIERFLASDAELVEVAINSEESALVQVEEAISRGKATTSLLGRVKDAEHSQVSLIAHDGSIGGSIVFYDTNRHFQYGAAGNGNIAIRQLSPSIQADLKCGSCEHHNEIGSEDQSSLTIPTLGPEAIQRLQTASPGTGDVVIDTVSGYGRDAREYLGGTTAMEIYLIDGVNRMNLAFRNSGISGVSVELLGTIEDPDYDNSISTDAQRLSNVLSDLSVSNDGKLEAVSDFATHLGADQTSMIISRSSDYAGLAYRGNYRIAPKDGQPGEFYTPGWALATSVGSMNTFNWTYAHEFAHNIGCGHAWIDNLGTLEQSFYGWKFKTPNFGYRRTIMAYNNSNGPFRVPHFSNPDILFDGVRTGASPGYDARNDDTVDELSILSDWRPDRNSPYITTGYDGTNPRLGADNAGIIQDYSHYLAALEVRSPGELTAILESGEKLFAGSSSLRLLPTQVNTNTSQSVTITNTGSSSITGISIQKTGRDADAFSISSPSFSLSPGQSTTVQISFRAADTSVKIAELSISHSGASDSPLSLSLYGAVRVLVMQESFESGIPSIWYQDPVKYGIEWIAATGPISGRNTGPSQASDGSTYIHLDTASSTTNGKMGYLSEDFNFSNHSNLAIQFDYHMYGSGIDSLYVAFGTRRAYSDHIGILTINGQQQAGKSSAWKTATIEAPFLTNLQEIGIRIWGTAGSNTNSSIAIDNIRVYGVADSGSYYSVVNSAGVSTSRLSLLRVNEEDGLTNLEKYAFNLDLTKSDYRTLKSGTGTAGLPIIYRKSTVAPNSLFLEYLCRKDSERIIYRPMMSETLHPDSWVDAIGTLRKSDIDQNWERATLEVPINGRKKLFLGVELEIR